MRSFAASVMCAARSGARACTQKKRRTQVKSKSPYKEYCTLALKVNKALNFGFRMYLVRNNMAEFVKRKATSGNPPLVITHLNNEEGVYIYGPNEAGSFHITLNQILANIPSSLRFTRYAKLENFKNVSLRIRRGSEGCKRQVNIHPSFEVTITINDVAKSLNVRHGMCFM